MAVSYAASRGLEGNFLSFSSSTKSLNTRNIGFRTDHVIPNGGGIYSPLANPAATLRASIVTSPSPDFLNAQGGVKSSPRRHPATLLSASVIANHGLTYDSSELANSSKGAAFRVEDEEDALVYKSEVEKIKEYVQKIKMMFRSQGDGEISVSPYDTAWVALVPALDGSEGPQFPKCLEWIERNQTSGGSWGDEDFFLFYDRIVNTLACVIALKTWGANPHAIEKGVKFIQENLHRMECEEDIHMPIGFEIVFPMMLKNAQALGLDLPFDAPVIKSTESERKKKLEKIPMEILHKHPTTLLHSLEGVHDLLDWSKLLKLQASDGSFLNSPASTACALMYTKDERCLAYIESVLELFGNAVPNVYPVDLFERMWMVDRLERLGIARYFEKEIKKCLDYVYEHWTKNGLAWSRTANVKDVDDTAMGFRLLRQHGYDVSADVFQQFRGKNGEFFCFAGQSGQAVTGMFNLYRASQTRYSGETILEEAYYFTRAFLEEKRAKKECYDKWIITKDLEGEVGYALDQEWLCSAPRIESRVYLDQYAANDVWIGKCLYRMYNVNNDTFLALAKADYNLCGFIHQTELRQILRWNQNSFFNSYGTQRIYESYFSAVTHLPMPERATARLVWVRNCILTSIIRDFFQDGSCLDELRAFLEATKSWEFSPLNMAKSSTQALFEILYNTVNAQIREGALEQDRDLGPYFRAIWLRWLKSIAKVAEWELRAKGGLPSLEEYSRYSQGSVSSEPVIRVTAFFLGEPVPEDGVSDDAKHQYLMELTNVVSRLSDDIRQFKSGACEQKLNAVSLLMHENPGQTPNAAVYQLQTVVNRAMLELSKEAHRPCNIPTCLKQLYFNAARIMILGLRQSDGNLGNLHIQKNWRL
ncbi:hypothetical protein R1flu_008993 [Riccia fluitans]|uniref:Uncharacterized protein n=1 Tax=Riccia fluitans TaxID=41844 RepID=A0ABD1Z0U6_9MARC